MKDEDPRIDPAHVGQAFDYVASQLSLFKLTKQEHMLIDQTLRQARTIALPPPTQGIKPRIENPKQERAENVQKELTQPK